MAQLSFQLPIMGSKALESWQAQRRILILAQCTHCERCTQDGRQPNRIYRQKSGVIPSIKQKRAGNAITYEDRMSGAKRSCVDGMVLRHGSDEVGGYMSRLGSGKALGDK